ncbi:MAG: MFS transporter [Nanoarchaeota archaeon]
MAISLRKFRFNKLSVLLFVGFITSIAISLLNGVWSLYFDSFFHNNSLVGYFSTILSVVALTMFFILTPIIEKYQENKVYFFAIFFSIALLVWLTLIKNFYLFVIVIVLYVTTAVLRSESFGIMVRNESKIKSIGKNEGLLYTLSNFGWVLGALLIFWIFREYNIKSVFMFAAAFTLIALMIFLMYKKQVKKPALMDLSLFKDFKVFFENKELKKLYLSSMGISLWLGFIFVYIPLYIVQNNFNKTFVGLFLFIFLLPFLLQYLIGKKSDIVGSKFFIVLGYLIIAIFTIAAYYTNHINNVLVMLILAGFGAAFIEPTKEIHFFKTIQKKQEEHYYGIYLTHIEFGLIIGKLLPAILFAFMPFNKIFLVMGGLMFLFFIFSLRLKDF